MPFRFSASRLSSVAVPLFAVCLSAAPLATHLLAQEHEAAPAVSSEAWVRAHYNKYEYRIPMRDGAKLFVSVLEPQPGAFKDHGPYPFLMQRTPYSCGPYGEDHFPRAATYSDELASAGYIFVCEDVRGRYQSEGVFAEMTPHIDEKKSPPRMWTRPATCTTPWTGS